jgi:hypothetical protein
MSPATVTLDSAVLEIARREADLRRVSVEEFVAESIISAAGPSEAEYDNSTLVRLMNEGILGDLGPLPSREEIYAERTQWPRS